MQGFIQKQRFSIKKRVPPNETDGDTLKAKAPILWGQYLLGFLAKSNENIAQGDVLSTYFVTNAMSILLYISFLLKNLTKNRIRIY